VQFGAPEAIRSLNLDYIFSRNWKHPNDQIEEWKHSSAKCAEVLIPHSIPSRFLVGALVANQAAKRELLAAGFDLRVDIDADLFFHGGG